MKVVVRERLVERVTVNVPPVAVAEFSAGLTEVEHVGLVGEKRVVECAVFETVEGRSDLLCDIVGRATAGMVDELLFCQQGERELMSDPFPHGHPVDVEREEAERGLHL